MHMRPQRWAVAIGCMGVLVLVGAALAQVAAGSLSPEQIDRLWKRHWRDFSHRYAQFEGRYVACPTFDEKYPSSANLTVSDAIEQNSITVKQWMGQRPVFRTITMPTPDGQALAMLLPNLALGEYGYIHSCVIDKVLGPDEMIVRDVWLLDPDETRKQRQQDRRQLASQATGKVIDDQINWMHRMRNAALQRQDQQLYQRPLRLKGFSTDGLVEQMRWKGPGGSGGIQIAIVKLDQQQQADGSESRRFVAAPADLFDDALDEQRFMGVLAERGLTIEQFVKIVLGQRLAGDPKTASTRVVQELERMARPTEPVATTPPSPDESAKQ